MEGIMNLRVLIVLGFAAFVAQPALAQTVPTTTQASFDSILAAGYEIKAVTIMSDAAVKEVYTTGGPYPSQVFITLQKGTSVAVCEMGTANWVNVQAPSMTDATRCFKH
jgi:hypothetical protein